MKKDVVNERCFLTTNNDPYFILAPLQQEVVMKSPMEIYIYHDVATSREMDSIRTDAYVQVYFQEMI